jgi:hypothetical protein
MKKRILLSLMSFFVMTSMWATLASYYQMKVTASANGKTGETATLTLNLENKNAVTTWQCLVTLPEGVTYKEGTFAIVDGRYPEGYNANVVATVNGDGTVTFFCEGEEGIALTGTAGAVATFDVEVASEVVPNDYAVVVNNSDVTEVNGTTYHWKTANEYVWTIEEGAAPVIEGDVTGDGKVNFTDAQSVLTLMANDEYDASADVDHNGKVDFTDYQSILIIMAGE